MIETKIIGDKKLVWYSCDHCKKGVVTTADLMEADRASGAKCIVYFPSCGACGKVTPLEGRYPREIDANESEALPVRLPPPPRPKLAQRNSEKVHARIIASVSDAPVTSNKPASIRTISCEAIPIWTDVDRKIVALMALTKVIENKDPSRYVPDRVSEGNLSGHIVDPRIEREVWPNPLEHLPYLKGVLRPWVKWARKQELAKLLQVRKRMGLPLPG